MLQCKRDTAARFCSGQGFGIATGGGGRQCLRPDTLSPHCTGGGGGVGHCVLNHTAGPLSDKGGGVQCPLPRITPTNKHDTNTCQNVVNMLGNIQTEKLRRCYSILDAAVAFRWFFVWSCIPLWAGELLDTGRASCPETTDTIQIDSVFSRFVCSPHAESTRA